MALQNRYERVHRNIIRILNFDDKVAEVSSSNLATFQAFYRYYN